MALRTLDDVVPIQKGLACSWQDSLGEKVRPLHSKWPEDA